LRGDTPEMGRAEFPCEWVCGLCAAVCAYGAIEYSSGAVLIGSDRCTGCGHCVKVCPCGVLGEEEIAGL
jgi:Fe-S-cluster-containing hydrogenase component 2